MTYPEQGEPQGQSAYPTPSRPPQFPPYTTPYPNPPGFYPPGPPTPPRQSRGLGITALVLGIAAFLTGFLPWVGLLLAMAALAVSIVALVKKQPLGFALTGLILGALAFFTAVIVTIGFSAILAAGPTASDRDRPAPVASSEVAAPTAASPEPTAEVPAEEPAAPAPSGPDGSATQPYGQPYTARGLFGGEKYTLTGRIVDANANGLVEDWNQFNADAPAGFKYVIVELTMTGIDPDGVDPSLAAWDLSLATGEGNRYDNEYIVFDDGMSSMSKGPKLYPGNSFTGYNAYIVPESSESFLLYDNGNYISF